MPIPANITLAPASLSFTAVGQSEKLIPTVTDQQGNTLQNAAVTWSTSNPVVADVSTDGTVIARSVGSAEVTAVSGPASATVPVVVSQAPTQLQKIAGDGQTGIAGQPLPAPLVVEVNDAQGAPVSGATVTFTVTQGGGSLATPTSITDS
ncbi:MAG TPA: Ig-like domain-containing protein, partial [Gemmatimonadales bacterium]|nr:Ig-like domain-containing protein [Gemmatimonadales bacterium]